jgi:hypothetical protein
VAFVTASAVFRREAEEEVEEGGASVLSDTGGLEPGKIKDVTEGRPGGDSGVERVRLRGACGSGVELLGAVSDTISCEDVLPASVTLLELGGTGLGAGKTPLLTPLLLLLIPLLLLLTVALPNTGTDANAVAGADAASPLLVCGTLPAMFSWGTKINDCVARSALTEERAAEGAWRGLLTFRMLGPSLQYHERVRIHREMEENEN